MVLSSVARRKIKAILLEHTTSINLSLVSLRGTSQEPDASIFNIKTKVNTIINYLSQLNGNYDEETQENIKAIIVTGKRISRHRERSSILSSQQTFEDWIAEISSLSLRTPTIMPIDLPQKIDNLQLIYEKSYYRLRFLERASEIMIPVAAVFILLTVVSFFVYPEYTVYGVEIKIIAAAIAAIFIIFQTILADIHGFIAKRRPLTTDDLIYIYTGRVIFLLNGYIKQKIEKDRIEATKSMSYLITSINKWTYGNLTLIKNQYGPSIDSFKEYLSSRTLRVTNIGSDQDIQILIDALSNFIRYMNLPSVKKLDDINNLLEKLDETPFIKFTHKDKILYWIYNKPNYLRVISGLLAATSFYLVGIFVAKSSLILLYPTTGAIFFAVFLGIDRALSLDKRLVNLNEKRSNAGII